MSAAPETIFISSATTLQTVASWPLNTIRCFLFSTSQTFIVGKICRIIAGRTTRIYQKLSLVSNIIRHLHCYVFSRILRGQIQCDTGTGGYPGVLLWFPRIATYAVERSVHACLCRGSSVALTNGRRPRATKKGLGEYNCNELLDNLPALAARHSSSESFYGIVLSTHSPSGDTCTVQSIDPV